MNDRWSAANKKTQKKIADVSTTCDQPLSQHMGVSKFRGTPKWMVYNGKPYEEMDDLGGFPPIFGSTPHISTKYTWANDELIPKPKSYGWDSLTFPPTIGSSESCRVVMAWVLPRFTL